MTETIDRLRRIETMLCRHIAGEPDKRTNTSAEVWSSKDGWEIEVNSLNVPLYEILALIRAQRLDEPHDFVICENGKPRMIVREICDTVTKRKGDMK